MSLTTTISTRIIAFLGNLVLNRLFLLEIHLNLDDEEKLAYEQAYQNVLTQGNGGEIPVSEGFSSIV